MSGTTQWHKDAIIYEVHVKAFRDSNRDGYGDFVGLMERLPYLEELGVNCVWLLPFYHSPLRDDGYDISDYRNINPSYGKMADWVLLRAVTPALAKFDETPLAQVASALGKPDLLDALISASVRRYDASVWTLDKDFLKFLPKARVRLFRARAHPP